MELVIVVIVVVLILAVLMRPGRCSVCKVPIKKKYYVWKINGTKSRLCPKCNGQMERKVSREAFKSKYG